MADDIVKKKVSELPSATNIDTFLAFGVETSTNRSVKVPMPLLRGNVGPKGDKGDTGTTGAKGDKGDPGATGAKGDKGDKGDAFVYSDFTPAQLEALKGPKGDKGDTGATGAKGDKGDPGDTGAKGDKGDKGDPGATGAKGDKGDTGDKGDSFKVDATGLLANRNNYDGQPDGFAYLATDTGELYIRQGVSGWSAAISFGKGEKGDKGDPGDKGDTGDTGAQGAKGDKGDAFTYSDFTTQQLESLKGEKGDKGDKGDTGAQGEKGDKGDKGDPGDKGATGDTGAQGAKGDKGDAFTYSDFTAQQLESLKGEKGEKGDTGAQGEKGDKGDKGDPGENATTTAVATGSTNGLMSYDDKSKLDGIATEAQKNADITKAEIEAKLTGAITSHTHAYVGTTGNETIAGTKTFSAIPVLPASNPTTDNQAVRKKYVDDGLAAKFDANKVQLVSSLPGSPTAGTIYLIPE